MTHKEKAKELVEKFENEIGCSDFHIPKFISGVSMNSKKYADVLNKETFDLAKQCALICVDEKIETLKDFRSKKILIGNYYHNKIRKLIQELREVKQEINNL